MTKKQLTEIEAYSAMFAFLEMRYEMTTSDDLAGLLGSLSLLPDGSPADPAVWQDWIVAVDKAKAGRVDSDMKLE